MKSIMERIVAMWVAGMFMTVALQATPYLIVKQDGTTANPFSDFIISSVVINDFPNAINSFFKLITATISSFFIPVSIFAIPGILRSTP